MSPVPLPAETARSLDFQLAPDWARRLWAESDAFRHPVHLPGLLRGADAVLALVEGMFERFSPTELPRVRAWVQGGQRYTITDALVASASDPAVTLQGRLADASGSAEFCATFNGLSAWCPEFAARMQARMLQPLYEALGAVPSCGTDFYAFFGNYGYTPFGVHDDTDQSLLWHLGPATKVAYVWPRAEYERLTGGTLSTTDYEALLPHARRFLLAPGDLLFIPMGDFHILETREFSATLGLTVFPDDPVSEVTEGLRLLCPDGRAFDQVGDGSLTLKELAAFRRAAVRSNGGVISVPRLPVIAAGRETGAEALHGAELRPHPSYPLISLAMAGRQVLCARGRLVWGKPNPVFDRFCDEVNRTPVTTLARLVDALAPLAPAASVTELVRTAVRFGAIDVVARTGAH